MNLSSEGDRLKKQNDKKGKAVSKKPAAKKKKTAAGQKKPAGKAPASVPRGAASPTVQASQNAPVMEKVAEKKKWPLKISKKALIVLLAACALFTAFYVVPHVRRANTYKSAVTEIRKGGDYEEAREKLLDLGDYKSARVLSNYALALKVYNGGRATAGVALDQITICLMTIPDDYSGELADDIKAFKNQFGGYRIRREDYQKATAFLHPETATEEPDASASRRSDVKHNNNFYGAVEAFYENAQHFWDEK